MTTKPIPEVWRPIEKELRVFYRALPQLIANGKAGHFSLIRGEQLINTWKTYSEASHFGHETFDDGLFIIQPIDRKMIQALSDYFGPIEPAQAGAA